MATAYTLLMRELDETVAATYWNENQPLHALNEGLVEVAARVPGRERVSASLSLVAGQEFYNLPSTVMVPQHLLNADGKECFPTTHANLEDWSAGWRSAAQGKPAWVVAWDVETLRVFPKPDASYTYTLVGVPWPAEQLTTAQSIGDEGLLQTVVVLFAAARLLQYTQPELAQMKRLQGEEALVRYQRNLRKQGGWNTLRIRPGTGWSLARAGGDLGLGRRYQ